MKDLLIIREAEISDVKAIWHLLEIYAAKGVVLSRTPEDISFFIRNFTVAEFEGKVCGCAAVRDFGNDLLEVRSLVVAPGLQSKGIGRAMVNAIMEKLKVSRKNWRLFALTMRPDFFLSLGFNEVSKELFPEKIWSDCAKCAKRDCCDETAVMIDSGE